MMGALQMKYNRGRQAVITNELYADRSSLTSLQRFDKLTSISLFFSSQH